MGNDQPLHYSPPLAYLNPFNRPTNQNVGGLLDDPLLIKDIRPFPKYPTPETPYTRGRENFNESAIL